MSRQSHTFLDDGSVMISAKPSRIRSFLPIALGSAAVLLLSACSGSGGGTTYASGDPLDDKSPAEMREQAQELWRELPDSMRTQVCYDLAALDPSAAQALLRSDAPELGRSESQFLYFSLIDLCS